MVESAPFPHKPVQDGKCTACHTPHSTNYPKQLKNVVAEVCFICHKKMARHIKENPYRHGPVRDNQCSQCHMAHGSRFSHLLRSNFFNKFYGQFSLEKYTLCFDCHNPRMVLDPQSMVTGFRNGTTNLHYLHVNRKKRGRNCKTCHAIHASRQENHIREKIPFRRGFSIALAYTKTATGGGCVVGCHKPRRYDRKQAVSN